MNWNYKYRFVLSSKGWDIYNQWCSNNGHPKPKREKTIDLQLWQAAEIFGPHLYPTIDGPFLDSSFTLVSK